MTRLWVLLSLVAGLSGPASAGERFDDLDALAPVRAPRGFDLIHTKLDVTLDFKAAAVSGTSTVTIKGLAVPVTEIALDAVAMEIRGVTRAPDGRALSYEYDGNRVIVTLPEPLQPGETMMVAVAYRATPKRGLHFVRASPRRPKGHREAWTQGEDEYTRHWLPSVDRTDDMGTTEALVTVPRGLSVLSNGRLIGKTVAGDTVRWHWRQDKPHVAYLIMLAAGPYEVRKETWRTLPVSFWYRKWDAPNVARTFEPTLDVLTWFHDDLGLVYPWDKYDQVIVSDYLFGGMENTSATVLNADTLHDARAEPDYPSQDLIVHELAHQWFGNLVTCRDWAHIWLNEGLASWFEALYREHAQGWDDAIADLAGTVEAVEAARARYDRPVVTTAYGDSGHMFDTFSYGKGALVLHALRGWVDADAALFAGLRLFLTRHAHQAVETDQLRRAIEDATGLDLRRFFEQWLHKPGLPKIEASYSWEFQQKAVELTVRQTQPTDGGVPLYRLPVDLRFAKGARTLASRRVWIDGASKTVVIPLPERPNVIEVDPRGWTPGVVEVDWHRDDALATLVHGSSVVTKRRVARMLGSFSDDEAVGDKLAEAGTRAHWWVAVEALGAIAKLNVPERWALVQRFATHPHARVRAAYAEVLPGVASAKEARRSLEGMLDDRSYRVIAAAAGAYPRVARDASALKRLAKVASIDGPWSVVSAAALGGMGRIGGKRAVELLDKRVSRRERSRTRSAAYRALGAAASGREDLHERVVKRLSRALDDEDWNVRFAAVGGFGALGAEAGLEVLTSRLGRESGSHLKERIAEVIKEIRKSRWDTSQMVGLEDKVHDLSTRADGAEQALQRLERRLDAVESALPAK